MQTTYSLSHFSYSQIQFQNPYPSTCGLDFVSQSNSIPEFIVIFIEFAINIPKKLYFPFSLTVDRLTILWKLSIFFCPQIFYYVKVFSLLFTWIVVTTFLDRSLETSAGKSLDRTGMKRKDQSRTQQTLEAHIFSLFCLKELQNFTSARNNGQSWYKESIFCFLFFIFSSAQFSNKISQIYIQSERMLFLSPYFLFVYVLQYKYRLYSYSHPFHTAAVILYINEWDFQLLLYIFGHGQG